MTDEMREQLAAGLADADRAAAAMRDEGEAAVDALANFVDAVEGLCALFARIGSTPEQIVAQVTAIAATRAMRVVCE